MARLSAQDAAAKWASRVQGATEDYKKGVQSVGVAPGQRAKAQAQVAKLNYSQAIDSGRWGNAVAAVDLGTWQAAAINKGAPRLASGAQAAQSKMTQFMSNFLPKLDNVTTQVRNMPSGTLQQNIQRAVAQMEGVAKLKGTLK